MSSIATLPPELISSIIHFALTLDGIAGSTELDDLRRPIYASVCRAWNDIIQRNALFWSTVFISFDNSRPPEDAGRLRDRLRRSRDHPLTLRFQATTDPEIGPTLVDELLVHANRVVDIKFDGEYCLHPCAVLAPFLRHCGSSLIRLHLPIFLSDLESDYDIFPSFDRLEHLSISGLQSWAGIDDFQLGESQPLLPALRTLRIIDKVDQTPLHLRRMEGIVGRRMTSQRYPGLSEVIFSGGMTDNMLVQLTTAGLFLSQGALYRSQARKLSNRCASSPVRPRNLPYIHDTLTRFEAGEFDHAPCLSASRLHIVVQDIAEFDEEDLPEGDPQELVPRARAILERWQELLDRYIKAASHGKSQEWWHETLRNAIWDSGAEEIPWLWDLAPWSSAS